MSEMFGFVPPEVIRARQEQQMMAAEAEQLAIEHLLDNLTPEDLATLRVVLNTLVNDEKGRLAAYLEGVCATMLRVKYDVCPGCGEKHDSVEDMLDAHGEADSVADNDGEERANSSEQGAEIMLTDQNDDGTKSLFEQPDAFSSKPLPDVYVDASRELIGQKGLMTEDLIAKMVEYNMDDLRDEDTGEIRGFICLNCRTVYPSLEDRMLKAPDDCSGCHQKSAWG